MPRTCPDCRTDLSQKDFFGVTLDTCCHCAGIFFDEGEVSRIREQGGNSALDALEDRVQPDPGHVDSREVDRLCPGCHTRMRRYRYLYSSPIHLDTCDSCGGVWVQDGELKQMREYLDSAKEDSPAAPPASGMGDLSLKVLSGPERARAIRARIAASTIAYHQKD
ncbi:MAG: zf-TFIIB domain-containing protein [Fimbriimonas sp.]|nr:zf-TFIIB domain-containing protein [Fimbriimonas sp.]